VIRGPADGYTLLFIGGAQFSVVPLVQDVTYDPLKELAPISIAGINGSVLAVPVDAPYQTLKEFLQYARDNPGKVAYSTAGPATVTHLVAALLAGRANVELTHVPFKSGPEALTALMSKSVQMHFGNSSDMIEPVRSGTVKALGVSTSAPMSQIPTIPPVAETIPGFELLGWNGYFAPAGTPKEILAQLSEALRKIAQDPELKSRLNNLGIETTSYTPDEISQIINKDIRLYSEIVDMARLRRK
jgi:tripartite-type tricarboxylate transporter receptor subunit TctC